MPWHVTLACRQQSVAHHVSTGVVEAEVAGGCGAKGTARDARRGAATSRGARSGQGGRVLRRAGVSRGCVLWRGEGAGSVEMGGSGKLKEKGTRFAHTHKVDGGASGSARCLRVQDGHDTQKATSATAGDVQLRPQDCRRAVCRADAGDQQAAGWGNPVINCSWAS